MNEQKATFNKGESAPKEADYVCVPCGYQKHYQTGESFTECISCFSGTPSGHEEFAEGLELWEESSPANSQGKTKTEEKSDS